MPFIENDNYEKIYFEPGKNPYTKFALTFFDVPKRYHQYIYDAIAWIYFIAYIVLFIFLCILVMVFQIRLLMLLPIIMLFGGLYLYRINL